MVEGRKQKGWRYAARTQRFKGGSVGYKLAMYIFIESKSFPSEELYSLTDQIRRSSSPVAANIAEGFRKRQYPNMFVSKMADSDSEGAETQVWLDFARDCK
jgi:four helix bundle protein